jgi:hypothetical protein
VRKICHGIQRAADHTPLFCYAAIPAAAEFPPVSTLVETHSPKRPISCLHPTFFLGRSFANSSKILAIPNLLKRIFRFLTFQRAMARVVHFYAGEDARPEDLGFEINATVICFGQGYSAINRPPLQFSCAPIASEAASDARYQTPKATPLDF